ncbi:hypothetical protein D3C78_1644600 [compost metagenome]
MRTLTLILLNGRGETAWNGAMNGSHGWHGSAQMIRFPPLSRKARRSSARLFRKNSS